MKHSGYRLRTLMLCGLTSLALLGGCATTGEPNPRDPFEPINRAIYQFNEGLDKTVVSPAAELYRGILPQFVRTGVSNFFANINDVLIALNNLLQGKLPEAVSDVGRLAVNTTVGLLGVLDVATEVGLEKHDEDFGQTLGRWGVGDGPYIVLPFWGPSNLRDALATIVDYKTDPVTYVDPTRDRNQLWAARAVNRRSELLGTSSILETAALDPYEFLRDAYLQRRRNLIYDGSPPPEKDDDMEIPMKPRTEGQDAGPSADSSAVHSILVSGDAPTPAELEALEKSSRGEAQAHLVRVWLPDQR